MKVYALMFWGSAKWIESIHTSVEAAQNAPRDYNSSTSNYCVVEFELNAPPNTMKFVSSMKDGKWVKE